MSACQKNEAYLCIYRLCVCSLHLDEFLACHLEPLRNYGQKLWVHLGVGMTRQLAPKVVGVKVDHDGGVAAERQHSLQVCFEIIGGPSEHLGVLGVPHRAHLAAKLNQDLHHLFQENVALLLDTAVWQ